MKNAHKCSGMMLAGNCAELFAGTKETAGFLINHEGLLRLLFPNINGKFSV